jgi:hypothetical protein
MCDVYECKKYTLLLGMMALQIKMQTSTLAGSMLRDNCPIFSLLAQPPLPLPPSSPHMRTLTATDDINMPKSSSVRHNINHVINEQGF